MHSGSFRSSSFQLNIAMANTGAGKAGKSGEKSGACDTINFIYSSAVEAALQQLEKDNHCVVPALQLSPPTKTRNKKGEFSNLALSYQKKVSLYT